MTLVRRLLCTLLLALPMLASAQSTAPADAEARKEAARLLEVMNMEEQLQSALKVMMDMQLQEKPELVRYRHVMEAFFAKHMSFAALREPLVEIYAQEFTAEEMRAASEFYGTPMGRKFLEKMPRLMQLGGELGQRQVMENMGDLIAGIQAEDARLAAEAGTDANPADSNSKAD
jgi:hypothetical protein